MQFSQEKLNELKSTLTFTVEPTNVNFFKNRLVKKLQSKIKINGFRNGKIPEGIILKRYNDYIKEQILNSLIEKGLKGGMYGWYGSKSPKKGVPAT